MINLFPTRPGDTVSQTQVSETAMWMGLSTCTFDGFQGDPANLPKALAEGERLARGHYEVVLAAGLI
jgi:hypothetical protein